MVLGVGAAFEDFKLSRRVELCLEFCESLVPLCSREAVVLVQFLRFGFDLPASGLQLVQFGVPVVFGQNSRHVPFELGQQCGSCHRVSEILMHGTVALLVRGVFTDRPTGPHDTDHEGQLWCGEVLADVTNKLSHEFAVKIIAADVVPIRIDVSANHVVPALKPDETSQLVARFFIIRRANPFDILQNLVHLIQHQAVVVAACGGAIGSGLSDVFALFFERFQLPFIELVGAGAWRAEVGVQ